MVKRLKNHVSSVLKSVSAMLNHMFITQASIEATDIIKDAIVSINNVVKENSIIKIGENFTCLLENPVENKEQLHKTLESYILAIESIPTTQKVVFIAEFSSRWDALESVYLAFQKDAMFETEVIVVPVTLRDEKGEITLIHGDTDYLTPLSIPHTPYDRYSFKEDTPDIVFFCLPYDWDRPPEYHLKNIRAHSLYMVYIPYAALVHRFDERKNFKDSEVMRGSLLALSHVDAFIATGDGMVEDIEYVTGDKTKLVPLGSPKVDFLVSKRSSNNWTHYPNLEEKIKDKTTFFLNTHFRQGVLCDNNFYEFFETLINYFSRDTKIALIWRPHPNTFTYVGAYGKKYSEKLLSLMKKMDNCNNIAIDTTPNHVAAFLYSHAVISHLSSIISLSVALNKPTFVLDSYSKEREENPQPHPLTNLPCYGSNQYPQDDSLVTQFIENTKNNIDTHAEKRALLCKYLFNNIDGTCGQKIYEYVKNEVAKCKE